MKKLIVLLLIFLLSNNTWAQEDTSQERDFKKPLIYGGSFMAVGYVGLVTSDEIANPHPENFKNAFRSGPRKDDDSDLYNFILHPLWGSETYLRGREANFGVLRSAGFNFSASVAWEYFIESWSAHPSSQDLVSTTGIGCILGEIRYKLKQNTSGNFHWLIDPINTTLEHLNIGVTKDEEGHKVAVVNLSWNF